MGKLSKKDVLNQIPVTARDHVEVVTLEDEKIPMLLHVSDNKSISKFTPSVSKRTMNIEDRTVARVSVSDTLGGCLAGHSSTHVLSMDGFYSSGKEFDGLWQVYGFIPEYFVKPKTKLVPDAKQSGEYWLVAYSKDTIDYKPVKVATFFYNSITLKRASAYVEVEMYVTVNGNQQLKLDDTHTLTSGKWVVIGYMEMNTTKRWGAYDTLVVKSVAKATKENFDVAKRDSLTLKSDTPSAYTTW